MKTKIKIGYLITSRHMDPLSKHVTKLKSIISVLNFQGEEHLPTILKRNVKNYVKVQTRRHHLPLTWIFHVTKNEILRRV